MQQYKSSKNIELEKRLARKLAKQDGQVPFELDANKSAKITVPFSVEHTELPHLSVTLIVNDANSNEFEVSSIVTGLTTKDFTINIGNVSDKTAKGIILWRAE